MIIDERNTRTERLIEAARAIMTAARTAPKARGGDFVETATLTDDHIAQLAAKMHEIGIEREESYFVRDAASVGQTEAVVLIGVRNIPRGLDCGACGATVCASKPAEALCTMDAIDLGIAIGSACATAADLRIDTRVMHSAGVAAARLGLLGDCRCIYAMPLSISSKNPFFDRKTQQ